VVVVLVALVVVLMAQADLVVVLMAQADQEAEVDMLTANQ
jgi:hypothetical protein